GGAGADVHREALHARGAGSGRDSAAVGAGLGAKTRDWTQSHGLSPTLSTSWRGGRIKQERASRSERRLDQGERSPRIGEGGRIKGERSGLAPIWWTGC